MKTIMSILYCGIKLLFKILEFLLCVSLGIITTVSGIIAIYYGVDVLADRSISLMAGYIVSGTVFIIVGVKYGWIAFRNKGALQ